MLDSLILRQLPSSLDYHAIETGSGFECLAAFCVVMNIPCLTRSAYYKQVDKILDAFEDEALEEMKKAG